MREVLCIGLMLFVLVKPDDTQYEYCTQLSFDKILSRRKRYLTYPDGSSFAVKRSFSKAILGNIPRGLNLNIDCGVYYPLPGSKDPWNPDKILYRLNLAKTNGLSATKKPKLKQKMDTEVNLMEDNIGVVEPDNSHPDLYFPSKHDWNGNLKSNWYRGKHYTSQAMPVWNPIRNSKVESKSRPGYKTTKEYYNRFSPARNLSAINLKNYKNAMRLGNVQWRHHREYRERREVYTSSEKLGDIFGINMKACMMRAICEMNDDFLPQGQSFILDAARILFDLPTDHDFEDDYGNIAKEKNVNCNKRFLFSCPYSPTEFLTRNVRLKNVKDPIEIKNVNV